MKKQTKHIFLLTLAALCIISLFFLKTRKNMEPTEGINPDRFRIVSYNVENLFDTFDDPETNDDDLTPVGKLNWTLKRYRKKLEHISETIVECGEGKTPAIVALCEVENDLVIKELLQTEDLKGLEYKYIITQSQDARGVDIALLYQTKDFKLIEQNSYRPHIGSESKPKYTRDILHAVGVINSRDTLDLFACHFPARGGGVKKSQPNRINVAKLLREKTDSITRIRLKANIIVMGDFNDTPKDKSMRETLGARRLDSKPNSKLLYNLFGGNQANKEIASYKYQGEWFFYDQFIVSGSLLNKKSKVQVINNEAQVFDDDFLLEDDRRNGGLQPYRTYLGIKYIGGYSDHLPIYMDLIW